MNAQSRRAFSSADPSDARGSVSARYDLRRSVAEVAQTEAAKRRGGYRFCGLIDAGCIDFSAGR